jgi:hypothetical protein
VVTEAYPRSQGCATVKFDRGLCLDRWRDPLERTSSRLRICLAELNVLSSVDVPGRTAAEESDLVPLR